MLWREQTQLWEEAHLSPFACLSSQSQGRVRPQEPCPLRTDFQRDIDRIVHCKAFRRLKQKTQVFLWPVGDHYRTRMTHTLEVSRIARTMARALTLNEDLTEAIALGHDLGHTPFGHAGERALNRRMPGGFSHNQQSLRVVERLERDGAGLNLTFEVRNGIVCHTRSSHPATLEGQVVQLADQIAYLNHDIEDALRGNILYPMDLPLELCQTLGFTKSERITTLVLDVIQTSQGVGHIKQSPPIRQAMADLRSFLFQAVYTNPIAKGEESKAETMLEELFEYYQTNPDQLPGDFQQIRSQEGDLRAVCDYIAGMTDSFAIEQAQRLFLPQGWAVK